MSPQQVYRAVQRRLLAEPHITHAITVVCVVAAATLYAVTTKDHSGAVWTVYGAAIGVGSGGRPTSNSRQQDNNA